MNKERILGYEIHRKKVKNINLRIKPNLEVYISVPMNLHRDYIENFIRSKEEWIKSVLKKVENVKEKQKDFEYKTGEIHKFLGKEYNLIVKTGNFNAVSLKNNIRPNELILTYVKRYINLNTELIKRTPFEIEYVILHELTHLKYPNHGRGFYNYIERYMPNYKVAEKMLNAKHYY